ncbi:MULTISPECIES: glycosyltransferase family 1 protein [Methylobacterium]|uniref:D-inositol-3-phosphate glycosyltransferase n=4 Tax=Pseudomonadota TaxID=1224 RepID=A0ABQ4SXD4_9HYPH|nr:MULTISPECIES: glycosyltransferase family 1 protein [Methylobacterium]PIU04341.1 MAG: glycosyltransferase family 1 protein [Methylobacterium sp. CG09_land_8_20_14_0_10_71_15]PIU12464.1 MAG: glycosyltransferase family 1 protein [Methylobacterium sp. CG08_land_8_20_14_0_20_71_15]GBU19605.1 capsular polysaccharide glycosyltransferase biosynthesis protein [Methylobacterium sp.]GJE06558.1 D-inositol-3-phosphate glycosyltransferase [Methylobacterium jeotgali]
MRTRPVAIDLTRLVTRLGHASPSGIDRVDLAYARHVLGGASESFGLVSTALGPRVLDRAEALRIVDAVAAGWVEDVAAADDPVYRRLAARLGDSDAGPVGTGPSRARGTALRRRRAQAESTLRMLRGQGVEALPEGAVYLHTSHLRLDLPQRFDWLYTRRDVRPVFFVHDIIPITHPEYGRPGEDARHAERMRTIGRHAAAVIANSADVGERTARRIAQDGFPARPVTVAHLGVEACFRPDGPRIVPDRPTFVACGTIEPRKNHLLLLHLWRALAERLGAATPRLVLVGRRGWEAENIVDMLERCPAIREHVVEVSGLSTHGLAALMRGATALLMPSFIEGYGLPVVEAAACGLPVVASDIAVHREIGERFAEFLDPLDGPGWARAVEALSEPGSPFRTACAARLDGYAPPTWERHFERADAAVAAL